VTASVKQTKCAAIALSPVYKRYTFKSVLQHARPFSGRPWRATISLYRKLKDEVRAFSGRTKVPLENEKRVISKLPIISLNTRPRYKSRVVVTSPWGGNYAFKSLDKALQLADAAADNTPRGGRQCSLAQKEREGERDGEGEHGVTASHGC